MKKLFIVFLAAFVFAVVNPIKSEAKVVYNGAEIVKGQTGKMTFSKDVKVYKKNVNGQFESMLVKKGNYFRVYNIEKYNGQTYYWMSSGYRVQATNLTVFTAIPFEQRVQFYDNPAYLWINRDKPFESFYMEDDSSGTHTHSYYTYLNIWGDFEIEQGELVHTYNMGFVGGGIERNKIDPTDIQIIEPELVNTDKLFIVTKDTVQHIKPYLINNNDYYQRIAGKLKAGTVLKSEGFKIGNYYAVNLTEPHPEFYTRTFFIPQSYVIEKATLEN
ncbi:MULTISPECIES: hypothetical protein [Lysinibacillus]|uniref:hypothetical protein n=1 Tax=Lysinibacillus TaxID=400634 RepID=UPI00083CA395|nr:MULTISPECIES: hypothetical protein [Lysinibacillus]